MVLLQIGELEIQLHRKAIKNLHLSVLPPEGCVRVSAPLTMTDTAIRMAVISRIPWIKKQRSAFINQSRQSAREMVNGECHYVWGRKYRLNIIQTSGQHKVELGNTNRLDMYVRSGTSMQNKNTLAVVIGIENYQYVPDAKYAYNDAQVFREYLIETLGVSKQNIKMIFFSKRYHPERISTLLATNPQL